MAKQLIRFDWAIKKMLRDKANFDILDGFLTVLLGEQITIEQVLESQSNRETENDRHNQVDLLVQDSKGELIIIEVQNSKEYDYFHRMVYGAAKVITEHIQKGDAYAQVKKVIAITIAYFDLGQVRDYVYHGTNEFRGLHNDDVLQLAEKQKIAYEQQHVFEIFPEYWIIKADKFNDQVSDKLDEWIYFLKNSKVPEGFTAPGLAEARKRLDEMLMSEEERWEYNGYLKHLRNMASAHHTKEIDHMFELRDAKKEGATEAFNKSKLIVKALRAGKTSEQIAQEYQVPMQEVIDLKEAMGL